NLGAQGSHSKVAAQGDLRASAQGEPVDRGDEDAVAALETAEQIAKASKEGSDFIFAHTLAFLQVGARAESLVARSGQNYGAGAGVAGHSGQKRLQLRHQGAANRVSAGFPLDGPNFQATNFLDAELRHPCTYSQPGQEQTL